MCPHRRRTDKNHAAIAAALTAKGCRVIDLSAVGKGCPDLLVLEPTGRLRLIEVKNPTGRDRLTDAQRDRIAEGWPIEVVRSLDDRSIGLDRFEAIADILHR